MLLEGCSAFFGGGGAGGGGFGVWVVLAGFPWGSSWICSTWSTDNAPQRCSGLPAPSRDAQLADWQEGDKVLPSF